MSSDDARKCTKTKRRVKRTAAPADLVYAIPQAMPVRSMKKERRYVKEGSGRCQVFLVSGGSQTEEGNIGKEV